MQRNVYIEGEMGRLFGEKMTINAPTVRDVFKVIEVNNSSLKKYLLDCHEKGIGFAIDVAGEEIEYEEELLLPLHKGDVTITPVAEGAGGGFKKILAALAIAALVIFTAGAAAPGMAGTLGGIFGTQTMVAGAGFLGSSIALSTFGYIALGLSVSLALSGLMEAMSPDPSVDADQEESYLFNGQEQNIIEGDPVPVLYGKLEVPGQPINFELSNFAPDSNSSGPFQEGLDGDTEMENITNSGAAIGSSFFGVNSG